MWSIDIIIENVNLKMENDNLKFKKKFIELEDGGGGEKSSKLISEIRKFFLVSKNGKIPKMMGLYMIWERKN